jgi:hypothetical protein
MSVYANSRKILHKGDGLVHPAKAPDVCKTPSPGGPIPVPYPNIARDGDLAAGAKRVTIEGSSVALKSSNLRTSTGDEAGTAGGGVASSKIKGKLTWASGSLDVKIEGKGVSRFLDVTLHNGNMSNTSGSSGGSGTGKSIEEQKAEALRKCHRKGGSASTAERHDRGVQQKLQKFNDKKRQKKGWNSR